MDTIVEEEKPSGPPESVITEVNETSDNLVFRKLLVSLYNFLSFNFSF